MNEIVVDSYTVCVDVMLVCDSIMLLNMGVEHNGGDGRRGGGHQRRCLLIGDGVRKI